MIEYSKIARGDILKLVGIGAPGYSKLGDLLRVTKIYRNSVFVEDRSGSPMEFVFNCGAARLEPTKWHQDFPDETNVTAEEVA